MSGIGRDVVLHVAIDLHDPADPVDAGFSRPADEEPATALRGRLIGVTEGLVGDGLQRVHPAEFPRDVGTDAVRDLRRLVEWNLAGNEGIQGSHLRFRIAVPGAPVADARDHVR